MASNGAQKSIRSFFKANPAKKHDARSERTSSQVTAGLNQTNGSGFHEMTREPALNKPSESSERFSVRPTKRSRLGASSAKESSKNTVSPKLSVGSFAYSEQSVSLKPQTTTDVHEKFVALLKRPGSVDDLRRRPEISNDNDGNDGSDEEHDAKRTTGRSKGPKKYTPLEKQIMELKRQNKDTILMFEVGYKYRLFGQDAAIACSEFGWYLVQGRLNLEEQNNDPVDALYDKFAQCSFPTHRLNFYIKRLVDRGYKVGVISQVETAALKAIGNNKSGPFDRKLTHLYTKGTYVDEFQTDRDTNNSSSGYLIAICEYSISYSNGRFGIIATHASSGDIVVDDFEDTAMLNELETRLLHIQPCEVLIVGDISSHTRRALDRLVARFEASSRIRVQEVDKPPSDAFAFSYINDYYSQQVMDSMNHGNETEKLETLQKQLAKVEGLSKPVAACLYALIIHLKAFNIDQLFLLTNNFTRFYDRKHMLLNANTLSSLEIFRNQTDYTEHGSLFWVMDHTRTQFGQRLLRKWVGNPLVDREELELRSQAVAELKDNFNSKVEALTALMKRLPDLEQGLINVHYKRQTYYLLHYLSLLSRLYSETDPANIGFKSSVLNELFSKLPEAATVVTELLSHISKEAAVNDVKEDYFLETVEGFEEIEDQRIMIAETEARLQKHLDELKKTLKKPHLKYTTVAGVSHLIEIKPGEMKSIPHDWLKMSSTKAVSRFRTPETIQLLKELDRSKERLVLACDAAYSRFLEKVSKHYEIFREVVRSVAHLDCLMSLAALSGQTNYCRPQYVDTPLVEIKEGRHPMVEHLLSKAYIANDVDMTNEKDRVLVITGPNMGGKSSYVRQVALICIMAQIGCFVPAKSAKVGILDAIYTRMGAHDNMLNGESTFMVELKECSDIMKGATEKSLVILDEIGRGTSTIDGVAIAYSVLSYFISEVRSLTLFVTHYPFVASFEQVFPGIVSNYHMGFIENKREHMSSITFLYQLVRGMADRSFGLNVARLAGIPSTIVDRARTKSLELENNFTIARGNSLRRNVHFLASALDGELEYDEVAEAVLRLRT